MYRRNGADQEYRPDIDGLRAVAVLSVIAFHAFPEAVPGGLVGVDIFFVISVFLISGIIFKNLEQGTFRFSEFYKRRVRRIFPALIIVLIACLAFGWFALLPDEYRQLSKHAAAAAAFLSNVTLWKEAGYFDTSSDHKPLLHLWSLGIEEQFYLVWPACLVLLWKRKNIVLWAVAFLAALSLWANLARIGGHPASTFYLPFTRFWELFLGGILAFLTLFHGGWVATLRGRWSLPLRVETALGNAAAMAGALLIAASIVLFDRHRGFPGWWALLPTVGSVFVISAGPDAWVNRTILRNPAMVLIGLISYPLYLWHWPLLSFARILGAPTPGVKFTLILASFVLAWASWRLVELKIRTRANLPSARRDIFVLSTGLASTGFLALLLFASKGAPGRVPGFAAVAKDLDGSADLRRFVECSFDPPKSTSGAARLPLQDQNHSYQSFCRQSKAGRADAAVLGDSHAFRLFNGIAAVDPGRTWLGVGNFACPPVLGIAFDGSMECAKKTREVFDYVGSQGFSTVVFAYFGYYGSPFVPKGDRRFEDGEEVEFRGLQNSIQFLVEQRKQVFLVVDVPQMPFIPQDCLRRSLLPTRAACFAERAAVDRGQLRIRRIVKRLKEHFPSIVVFDPLPLLCDDSRCKAVLEGFSYYLDDNHLSQRGSEIVSRSLVALIDRTGP
jgi:peptidoglycan/LPS O-acetylase OafA/YrhL